MIDVPAIVSPFRIVFSSGDGPRCLGRSDGWILIIPFGNILIVSSGRIFPYAKSKPAVGFRLVSC